MNRRKKCFFLWKFCCISKTGNEWRFFVNWFRCGKNYISVLIFHQLVVIFWNFLFLFKFVWINIICSHCSSIRGLWTCLVFIKNAFKIDAFNQLFCVKINYHIEIHSYSFHEQLKWISFFFIFVLVFLFNIFIINILLNMRLTDISTVCLLFYIEDAVSWMFSIEMCRFDCFLHPSLTRYWWECIEDRFHRISFFSRTSK